MFRLVTGVLLDAIDGRRYCHPGYEDRANPVMNLPVLDARRIDLDQRRFAADNAVAPAARLGLTIECEKRTGSGDRGVVARGDLCLVSAPARERGGRRSCFS